MSLRVRLLAGLAALVLFGLVTFGAGTYLALRRVLLNRLDQQLVDAADTVARASPVDSGRFDDHRPSGGDIRLNVGPDLFIEILDSRSSVLASVASASHAAGPPNLASDARSISAVHGTRVDQAALGTVDPEGHVHPGPVQLGPVRTLTAHNTLGGPERVSLTGQPGTTNTIVIAASLQPVTQTLHRLLVLEIATGAGVLAITSLLGLALARQATRPLEGIARTADAIAAGDLDRRVDAADGRSEVGRVGLALNAMLNEIQSAFARRDATETRLRRFVADASHELSTPLTSIRGYAELFHRGLGDHPGDLAKAMSRIESEGTRMGGLVDDLLLLASFDDGRPLQRDPVDLTRIIADAGADLSATCPDRTVTIDHGIAVIVLGDENRLRQVAANLTSNARRHTPEGSPITLRTRLEGTFGVMEVADRGPGLTAEAAEHVFDRFYRVDKARARADGGAGLGLSIVATVAEALDGHTILCTEPGSGATFGVAIPLARPEPEETPHTPLPDDRR